MSCALLLLLLLRVERNDRHKNKKYSDYHKKNIIYYILYINCPKQQAYITKLKKTLRKQKIIQNILIKWEYSKNINYAGHGN